MPRRNKNASRKKYETRLSFNELARKLDLDVRRRIIIRRYIIETMKGGGLK